MTAKKPSRKIDERWAHSLFRKLISTSEPETSREEIDALIPSVYKHRIELAFKSATKALKTRKNSWERLLLLRLIKACRPDCEDAETYDTETDDGNILTGLATEVVHGCISNEERLRAKDETFIRVIRDNNKLQTEIAQCRDLAMKDAEYVRDLRELVKNLRVSLKVEQRMNDALRASLSGSEIISVGPDGDVTTVRQHLRATAQERYDEVMGTK